jgi:hypothetical protein
MAVHKWDSCDFSLLANTQHLDSTGSSSSASHKQLKRHSRPEIPISDRRD